MLKKLDEIQKNTIQILKNQRVMLKSLARIEFKMTKQWQFRQGDIDKIGIVYETMVRKERMFKLVNQTKGPDNQTLSFEDQV